MRTIIVIFLILITHAASAQLNLIDIKLYTVEDPIEIRRLLRGAKEDKDELLQKKLAQESQKKVLKEVLRHVNGQNEDALMRFDRLDSIYDYEFTSDGEGANNFRRVYYDYDEPGHKKAYSVFELLEDGYVETMRTEYEYDEFLNEVSNVHYKLNENGELVGSEKREYAYNEYGKFIFYAVSYWNEVTNDWDLEFKFERSFDDSGNLLLDSWYLNEPITKMVYTYENGLNTQVEIFDWSRESESWEKYELHKKSYGETGRLTETLMHVWTGGSYQPAAKDFHVFNDRNDEIQRDGYDLVDDEWVYRSGEKNDLDYDEVGNIIKNVESITSDGVQYTNSIKLEYAYDDHGNQTFISWSRWRDEEWVVYFFGSYVYEGEIIIRHESYGLDENSGEMIGGSKIELNLDDPAFIQWVQYKWDLKASEWVYSIKYEYEWSEDHLLRTSIGSKWVDGDWVPTTKDEKYYSIDVAQEKEFDVFEVYAGEPYMFELSEYVLTPGRSDYAYQIGAVGGLVEASIDAGIVTLSAEEGIVGRDTVVLSIPINAYRTFTATLPVEVKEKEILEMSQPRLLVYPNPTQDFITINKGAFSINASYSIMTTAGAVMAQGRLADEYIDIAGYKQGIYLVIIRDGEDLQTFKVVKD